MRKILIILVIGIFFTVSGCSIFMPYKETFLCKVPEGKGFCGSLSDGYEFYTNNEK